jgi:hypothetical protein
MAFSRREIYIYLICFTEMVKLFEVKFNYIDEYINVIRDIKRHFYNTFLTHFAAHTEHKI